MRLRELLRELRDGYSYVRNPHGWEQRIRAAQQLKMYSRPAIFSLNNGQSFVVHPALYAKVKRELAYTPVSGLGFAQFGIPVYESLSAVENPPADGWPDVVVPARPRLRP